MKPLSLKTVAGLCAAAALGTVACAALAQPPQGGQGGFQRGPQGAGFQGQGGRGAGLMNPAQRAQRLHDELQITAAQEAAFQAWQKALQPPPVQGRPAQEMRGMTTPQRLDEELRMANEREGQIKARIAATKTFYNQLTPAQKQTMDNMPPQILLAMEGGPGGRGMGMGGPGGRGGPSGPGGRRGQGGPGGGNFDPNAGFGGQQPFGGQPPQ